ncbi:hypothetical protein [Bacillus thuringiensis]|uniref:hypothetical protein n=1 Tax=Bacillus thuringiensis TaxID=1428 RepID=UPI0001A16EF7|nr:hypothetical protein [Bacillus thuringiensis]EEM25299.1 hypothetical protein bthur0002_59410 [Bacillus thuringiensis Bt407]MCU5282106.1 hypothetical protein [Bacillus cereus]MED2044795.1 hypothetical protein [Bacillus thuringiensis]MED2596952.1 hypothetical protein [Bacillus thuringiensis]MEE2005207.1 hypothetical protein [Bacillus thuringiensis]
MTEILEKDLKEHAVDVPNMIQQSIFYELIKEEPLFATHYPPEYWSDEIYKEQIERK